MKPHWNGPYKIHADLGKGVYRLLNPSTGNVLKKAVNIARLKVYHSDMSDPPLPKSPSNSPPPKSPSNSPPPKSPSNSPPPKSPPNSPPSAVDPALPSPIVIDENAPTPEKEKTPAWIKSLQLFKSDQDVLIHGKELTEALTDAAQKLLSKKYLDCSLHLLHHSSSTQHSLGLFKFIILVSLPDFGIICMYTCP